MRILLWMSRAFLTIAVVWICVAWYYVWAEHRKEVERLRFVWGPDAKVPSFNPLDLFNFAKMKEGGEAVSSYVAAGLSGLLAFLCWLFQWRPANAKKRPIS